VQALQFLGCDNLKLGPLRHIDSPKNHISICDCNGALISHLHIIAPENSPNTDGIDISRSTNIFIDHSTISTGSILDFSLSLYIHVNHKVKN
jgi:polygalacturonase